METYLHRFHVIECDVYVRLFWSAVLC